MTVRDLAVLLMAYGSPSRPEDLPAYLADIRGGEEPFPAAVADLRRRYDAIGGRSPLPEITRSQGSELQRALDAQGVPAEVFVGMKHWRPFIGDVVGDIAAQRFSRILGVALAPHYSRMSIGAYEDAIQGGLTVCGGSPEVTMVKEWHRHPDFVRAWADPIAAIRRVRPEFGAEDAALLFTAHSLPKRIVEEGDPYPEQLVESSRAIAAAAGVSRWSHAWQSPGSRGAWLGPSVRERLEEVATQGTSAVLVAPIGFTSDHLEILYDLDIEARGHAERLGLRWARVPSLNAGPALVATLLSIIRNEAALGAPP